MTSGSLNKTAFAFHKLYIKDIKMVFSIIRLDQKHVGLAQQASPFLGCFWSCLINLISKGTTIMVFSITALQASIFLQCFWSCLINLISKDTNMIFSITARQALPLWRRFWSHLINLISNILYKYKTTLVSVDIKIIRLVKKRVGLARQASSCCFSSLLINLISKDTNMVFSNGQLFISLWLCTIEL